VQGLETTWSEGGGRNESFRKLGRELLGLDYLDFHKQDAQENSAGTRSLLSTVYNSLSLLAVSVLTMFQMCLFAILALLLHETAAFPALNPGSVTAWARNLNSLHWTLALHAHRDPEQPRL